MKQVVAHGWKAKRLHVHVGGRTGRIRACSTPAKGCAGLSSSSAGPRASWMPSVLVRVSG